MIIDELVCKPNEAQELIPRVVPEDYFAPLISDQITDFKSQLSASDYKVIKCAECSLAGLEFPYDIIELNAERQAIRNQINALEAVL